MTMGCRIMFDSEDNAACLYDSVTETVFGRRFLGDDAVERLEAFLEWLHEDPRKFPAPRVCELQDEWLTAHPEETWTGRDEVEDDEESEGDSP